MILAVAVGTTEVAADSTTPPDDAPAFTPPGSWEFTLTFGVWQPRLAGDATFGPSPLADAISIEDSFDLDRSDTVFNFEASLRKGDLWQLEVSGFDASADSSSVMPVSGAFGDVTFAAGDGFTSSLDVTSMAIEVTAWTWHPVRPRSVPGKQRRTDFRAGPLVGARYMDVSHSLSIVGGGSDTGEGEWLMPYAGLGLQLRYEPESRAIIDAVEFNASFAVGPALGGDGGTFGQLGADATLFFTDHLGVTFGYRLVAMGVENDDYEFNGSLQGLFLAATLRF